MTQLDLFDGAGVPTASPDVAQGGAETGLRRPFPVVVPRVPPGGSRARWGLPGVCRRADSGPLPGHRRRHLPSGLLPPLPARGGWPLCPPRGAGCQTPAAFEETGSMSAGRARRPRRRRCEGEDILMHRLLHHDRAGFWTWRERGTKVPAVQNTDVSWRSTPPPTRTTAPRLPDRIRPAARHRLRRLSSCREVPGLRECVHACIRA